MLKGVIVVFIGTTVLILGLLFFLEFKAQDEDLEHVLDICTLSLEAELKKEQNKALEIALILSKNGDLVRALENDDEDYGYKLLSEIVMLLQKSTGRYVRAQMITADYHVFARSWDNIYAGMPLEDYRQDLEYVKEHKSARTSIEIGRRLGIKATVPVYIDKTLLGFIEVIDFFESITEHLRSQAIELYVLLDYSYFEQVILMQENLIIDNYIVANRNYNFNNIQALNHVDFTELKVSRIAKVEDKYLFYETMKDGQGESIGAFVFVLQQKHLHYFKNAEDDISFLINVTRTNLYDIVKHEQYKERYYVQGYDATTLLYLKDIIAREDRELFYDELNKKLQQFSKEELINIMLEHKNTMKVDGKIR